MTNTDTARVRQVLSARWCALLETATVSDDDDFFGLGGTSLLAIGLVDEVEAELGITFPIDTLFLDGTFGALLSACVDAYTAPAATGAARGPA